MNSLEYEVSLLSKLVEIDTESVSKKGYEKCAKVIVDEAEQNALDVEIIDGEKGAKDGLARPNIIVTLDSGSDVTLLVESHFDIVPPGANWKYPPFKLTVENDRAYGRGSADNKSGIAAALGAMRRLKKESLDINIKLIAGVDEEIGGRYGVDYVMTDAGLKGDAALVVDSGIERLFLGASGILWGKVEVAGKQGHAGYPFKSINAISEASRVISALNTYKKIVEAKESALPAPPEAPRKRVWGRFSVTMIKGGEKENVIPGTCEFRFDRRLHPEEHLEEAEAELKTYFNKAVEESGSQASLVITNRLPGYHTSQSHPFVKTVAEKIAELRGEPPLFAAELGGNDGSFFAKHNIPVVCYGTIRADTRYHGLDEFVYLEDIEIVRNLILSLGRAPRESIATQI
ncbi:MAG: ArgE/DapE family deacylase [Candidatus Bathyarchaeota archaeon]|nr:MAG: ArgE/DapE family deacylase [Candidatus Bathyarchaeota archaeon]